MQPPAGKQVHSHQLALQVIRPLQRQLQSTEAATAQDLIKLVRDKAADYARRDLVDSVSQNACRRVLKIIREEAAHCLGASAQLWSSLQNSLFMCEQPIDYTQVSADKVRGPVATSISELTMELESSLDDLASHGAAHIGENEVVLTLGYSNSVAEVLRTAASACRFQVIVCDSGPNFTGTRMLQLLRAVPQVDSTLISDAQAFAAMSRVHRCLLSAQTVFADGGLRAECGTHGLLLAAKRHSVPVIVCAPTHKLAPAYHNVERGNQYLNPACLLDETLSFAEVHCPKYDLVPPGLVTLFVTNHGGVSPAHLHRCLADQYHQDDYCID